MLRNQWYVAAWAEEAKDGLVARTILNEPLVIFRGKDGKPIALEDRCPHRGVPLSVGRVVEGAVECGYHGICFGERGQCMKVPGQATIPKDLHAKSYPCVERWSWIWVWMGEAETADEALIADFHWLTD